MLEERAMKPLPEALTELIAARGMTQTDVWAAAGLSSSTLTRWTKGDRGREFSASSLDTLRRLSDALGVPLTYWREYRLYQIGLAFNDNPELDEAFYDQIMAYAADLAEQAKSADGRP